MGTEALLPGGEGPQCEDDHSSLGSVGLQNALNYTWCLSTKMTLLVFHLPLHFYTLMFTVFDILLVSVYDTHCLFAVLVTV
jgi:hypothetical protein